MAEAFSDSYSFTEAIRTYLKLNGAELHGKYILRFHDLFFDFETTTVMGEVTVMSWLNGVQVMREKVTKFDIDSYKALTEKIDDMLDKQRGAGRG